MTCIFCDIANGQRPGVIVWQDAAHLAILDINPCSRGHLLLIPRRHREYLFELPDAEYQAICGVAKRLATLLAPAVGAKRTGLVVEGFGVDHLHVHLVPVSHGGDIDPNKQRPAPNDELASLAQALVPALANA